MLGVQSSVWVPSGEVTYLVSCSQVGEEWGDQLDGRRRNQQVDRCDVGSGADSRFTCTSTFIPSSRSRALDSDQKNKIVDTKVSSAGWVELGQARTPPRWGTLDLGLGSLVWLGNASKTSQTSREKWPERGKPGLLWLRCSPPTDKQQEHRWMDAINSSN